MAFSSVQLLSRVQFFATPWTAARQAFLSITNSWSLLKFMSIEAVMPSNHLILYRPLLILPSIFPSIRAFSNESVLHIRWPKYWSFTFSISPSSEYSGLISFRIDWLDLLAVQWTLRSLFQQVDSLHQVAKVLKFQLQHQSFQWIFRTDFFFFFFNFFFLFYFIILYWFCHTLTWIHHGCTCDQEA